MASLFPSYYYFGSEVNINVVIFISYDLIKHYEKQWLAKWLLHVCSNRASPHQELG